jgi:putative ABC transport system substrate-binding protein
MIWRIAPVTVALVIGLLAAPLTAEGQQVGKSYHIGFLAGGARPADAEPPKALRDALQELGYVEGKTVRYTGRWAEAKLERLPKFAAELVQLKVDLIVTIGGPASEAAARATATIPIVTAGAGDVVGTGLVASLARPGGNLTGITDQAIELSAKRLEMLKEAVPKAVRVAVLWNADDLAMTLRYREIDRAAHTLGVTIQPLGVREPNDFDAAFSAMVRDRPDALFLVTDSLTILNRRRVLEFAAAYRIPAMYEFSFLVRDGGLMSYGPDLDDSFRRAAFYVDRIFRGAKPGELPVEQPIRFYLVVNLKTARALGLTIPQSILIRADEVIQ